MEMTENRHALAPLPALDGGDVALEIGSDLFPRIETIAHGHSGWW
jgi:hypothetical protein